MLTDLELANLCLSQYNGDPIFDHTITKGGDCLQIKYYPDCTAVLHEGSHDIPNWINNFNSIMLKIVDFGGVEEGFYFGLPEMAIEAIPEIPKDKLVYVAGHSRGAARAHIFAAMLIKHGYKVEVVTFGSPRPGDAELAAILATAANRSYRNFHDWDTQDWVCTVPLDLSLIAPFVHPAGIIEIDVVPPDPDPWGLLKMHHIQNYIKALQ